jgi:hypothetical protein
MQLLRIAEALSVKEVIDRALRAYELEGKINPVQVGESRERMTRYINKLVSAGHRDPHQLVEFASAYLKEIHEGHDPRFTGC